MPESDWQGFSRTRHDPAIDHSAGEFSYRGHSEFVQSSYEGSSLLKNSQFVHDVCHCLLASSASAEHQQRCLQASSGTLHSSTACQNGWHVYGRDTNDDRSCRFTCSTRLGPVLPGSSTHDRFHGACSLFKQRTRQTVTALTISSTVAPRDKSLMGFLKPCMIGPIAFAPARYSVSL